jgi:regulator of protease activity HflC (stomatin/prohibitin superfamily)
VGFAVEDVAVRDVMVPAELRRAAAEVATARKQGQAVEAGGATVVLTTGPSAPDLGLRPA